MGNSSACGNSQTADYGLGGRGAHLVIPSIIGPILAAFLVFNRVYWRISLVHQIGVDDICILLSLAFLTALCTANLFAVNQGYGRAQACLSPENTYRALQMFYLDQIFYKFSINLTKLSVLFLYLRIFSQRWFRITCYTCAAVVAGYAAASIIATIFQCKPVEFAFNKMLPGGGHCINPTAFWYANAIFNIVTDFIILASVPGVVWSLSLSKRQRVGLTLVFGLGGFVFATSVLRLTTLNTSSKAADTTYGTLKSTFWTTIEACTAVVCACLPMLRTPLQRLCPRILPAKYGCNTGEDSALGGGRDSTGGDQPYESLRSPTLVQDAPSDLEIGERRRDIAMRKALNSPMTRDASTMGLPPTTPTSDGHADADDGSTVAEEGSLHQRATKPPKKT